MSPPLTVSSAGSVRSFTAILRLSLGHYVENTGNTTLRFLEIFNSDRFEDVSLAQWLALTPPKLVQEHLQLANTTISRFNNTKDRVVGPKKAPTLTSRS